MLSSPCANCRNSAFLFLFISEVVFLLAGIVVGDAENTSIVIILRVNNSVVTIIEVSIFIDVDLIYIGIIRDDVTVET